MASVKVEHHAFVCGCGYGQAGDDGFRSPDAAKGWDGKTLVMAPAGQSPQCPNRANHLTAQARADQDRLSVLETELASLRARVGAGSSSSGAASGSSSPGSKDDPFAV